MVIRKKKRMKIGQKLNSPKLAKIMVDNEITVNVLEHRSGVPRCVLYRYLDGSRICSLESALRIILAMGGLVGYDDLLQPETKAIVKEDVKVRTKYIKMPNIKF